MYEYTNIYWNLLGLRAFVQAARWLGKADEAAAWQKEYDDFLAAFRKAAARDMKTDPHGNRYLPIRMDGAGPAAAGTMGFLPRASIPARSSPRTTRWWPATWRCSKPPSAKGMVYGTGWDATGIWNYFASFYGHAWLWQGNGSKAAQVSTPLPTTPRRCSVWREEQSLAGPALQEGRRHAAQLGQRRIHPADHPPARAGPRRRTAPAGRPARPNGSARDGHPARTAWPRPSARSTLRSGQTKTASGPHCGSSHWPPICHAIIVHLPGGGTRRIAPDRGGRIRFPVAES